MNEQSYLEDFADEFEERPSTCGKCTWLTDEFRCAHGAGPRTGHRVQPDARSCPKGKPQGTFVTDDLYRIHELDSNDYEPCEGGRP